MKQAQDLNQIHNKKNSPLSSDNNFNSSPIKSGSSPSTSDPISRANLALNHASSNEDKTSSSGGVTSKQRALFHEQIVNEMVDEMVTEAFNSSPSKSGSSPSTSDPISRANIALNHTSSNEDKTSSSGGVTSKQTACFRNAIVDEMVDGMVTEALNYAQDAKENSNCTPFTTGNIPSFHSNRTDHSEDGVSARSNYSQTDSSNSRHNVFFECWYLDCLPRPLDMQMRWLAWFPLEEENATVKSAMECGGYHKKGIVQVCIVPSPEPALL